MSIQPIGLQDENEPPYFLRAQALPYPDLARVWVRAQITEFVDHPELEMVILGPDGAQEAAMVMVDVQFTYVSLTMHLKHSWPGETYRLLLRLTRHEQLLDQRDVPFELAFVDRDQAKAEAEALTWRYRAGPIVPLEPAEPEAEG